MAGGRSPFGLRLHVGRGTRGRGVSFDPSPSWAEQRAEPEGRSRGRTVWRARERGLYLWTGLGSPRCRPGGRGRGFPGKYVGRLPGAGRGGAQGWPAGMKPAGREAASLLAFLPPTLSNWCGTRTPVLRSGVRIAPVTGLKSQVTPAWPGSEPARCCRPL